ncbi:conserved hypothetical protein (DUF748) [Formosa agariphila KMM 3901]|uniref:DUF748 domain-containing protein n=1 Tax=Formosa agariphila (strain DSM 15362 / KCTC 12365 / LMG 23005 / KMM 3901 / M-2Alg 35-1) TaxID=1347342 RepID=T2KJZ9_FORAG|nr:DUF748 domain-containing protein [Formosa agariphila]CDF78768.1 conserved hypothetical protein (DUF748) [Formosa agariphila KMM 3901]
MTTNKKWKIGGLAFVLIILLILIFVPTVIKNYAINNSKTLLGRQIDIDKLKLNYFTGTVKVINFKLFEADETTNFISFDTLILDTEPYRYLSKELVVEQFYLKGLTVNVTQQDSIFNFDDLIAFHTSKVDTVQVEAPEETEPLKYNLNNLELKDAHFVFNDKNVDHITNIEDFSFIIPFIGWNQEEKSNADLKFNFENGGYFTSNLNVNPTDGEYDARITIHDLYLNSFYKYAAANANINSLNGHLNTDIKIEGNINDAVKSIASGRVSISDFEMTDNNDEKFLALKNFKTKLQKIDYANSSYIIDSLSLTESYTHFKLDSVTNNFFKIFKIEENATATQDTLAEQPIDTTQVTEEKTNLFYAINHFNVNRGVLDYSDNLTGEQFDYHLSDIQINSDSISSKSDWVNIYSDMVLNNRGTLKAKLGANPLDTNNAEIDISIEDFLLSDINIYSRYYLSHDILEGDFYYNTKTTIVDGELTSENKLLIKNAEVSNTAKGVNTLPLKFALFLLKDKNGDVKLDVPIGGNMNDPSVSIGKVVGTTLKNLIVKTVASPVKFLGGLVGGDPKDLEEIEFTYLDTIPTGKSIHQLDKLSSLEEKKDGLKIEMLHYVDLDLQKEAIALAELGQAFNTETKKDYTKDEKAFETYLQTKVGSDSISVKDAILKLSADINLDALAAQYNTLLIKNTEAYLKEKNTFTKIKVLAADPKAPGHTGSKSRFKITYDLLEADIPK